MYYAQYHISFIWILARTHRTQICTSIRNLLFRLGRMPPKKLGWTMESGFSVPCFRSIRNRNWACIFVSVPRNESSETKLSQWMKALKYSYVCIYLRLNWNQPHLPIWKRPHLNNLDWNTLTRCYCPTKHSEESICYSFIIWWQTEIIRKPSGWIPVNFSNFEVRVGVAVCSWPLESTRLNNLRRVVYDL